MNRFDIIFANYSSTIDNWVEDHWKDRDIEIEDEQSTDMELLVKEAESAWLNTPVPELGGMTPQEKIKQIDTLEDALEAFKSAALHCVDEIPAVLLEKLRSFGPAGEDGLIGMISGSKDYSSFSETYYIDGAAISLLGEWKAERSIPVLIDVIKRCSEEDDFIADRASGALIRIGRPVLEPLLQEIEGREDDYKKGVYMEVISHVGGQNRDNRVYQILRQYFLDSEDKGPALVYITDFNDPRFIPFLRGYLEKNNGQVGFVTYALIRDCIEQLGGSVEDIDMDFSGDPEYIHYMKQTSGRLESDGRKVGRNDPCPCGSGKKYKKCCGR